MTDEQFQEHLEANRKRSDPQLARWVAGWAVGSDQWIAADYEIRRRHESRTILRAWIAIGISTAALVVSIFALVPK